ncbi:MAG TPA: C45 family peptidase [Noviherbaspirillum sp.]|uniref:C45 family peptidase n=1 Tax=Noviherbaspirillum sp. TaxID=1926288 RepID=UPI002B493902|nr:C45 family peptidase [Noviherbaspirillum sp.]HJV84621.1 C45 family peptidase [Noviherbaspirillum sp.]
MIRIIEGDPFAVGEALGQMGKQALGKLYECADWQRLQKWRGGRVLGKLIERTQKAFPEYWEEIRGIGAGLGMAPADVFLWNCRNDLLATSGATSSSIAVNRLGAAMVAQWLHDDPVLAASSEVVEVRPQGKPGFLAPCLPACIPGVGFAANRAGVVQVIDNIEGGEFSLGIPSAVIGRAVLDAGSLADAVALVMECERMGSCHHTLAAAGEFVMVGIEADPLDRSLVPIANKYCHANHRRSAQGPACGKVRHSSAHRHAALESLLARMPAYPLEEDVLPLLDPMASRASDAPGTSPLHPANGDVGTAFFKITPEQIHVRLWHSSAGQPRHLIVDVEANAA